MSNILKKIPGFRSGVKWKKIVASIGYGLIFIILLGSMLGDPVTTQVNAARDHVDKGAYDKAVQSYESAIRQWDDSKEYNFAKDTIMQELNAAKAVIQQQQMEAKVEKLLNEAETAKQANKPSEAVSKLQSAATLLPNHPRISVVRATLADYMSAEADKHIDLAVSALKEYDASAAETAIQAAVQLYPDHSRVATLRTELSTLKQLISEIGPKPLNSAWDAAVAPVVDYFKGVLNDPKSVQYEEWSPVMLDRKSVV